jgi:phosphonate metabolism protein PhnN/1,5-bisphosphokinase (PRPP-forming)
LLDHLEKGGVVIANGSRKVIPVLSKQFPNFIAVNLTVEKSILAKRLLSRGREGEKEIERRLNRTDSLNESNLFGSETVHIDNSGSLEIAGASFVELIESRLT